MIEQKYRGRAPFTSQTNAGQNTQSTLQDQGNDFHMFPTYQSQNQNLSAYLNPHDTSNHINSNSLKNSENLQDLRQYNNFIENGGDDFAQSNSEVQKSLTQTANTAINKEYVTEKSRNYKTTISRTQEPTTQENTYHKSNMHIQDPYVTNLVE